MCLTSHPGGLGAHCSLRTSFRPSMQGGAAHLGSAGVIEGGLQVSSHSHLPFDASTNYCSH